MGSNEGSNLGMLIFIILDVIRETFKNLVKDCD